MPEKAIANLLSKLTAENVWMLVVDGKFHYSQHGPEGYEAREPNSISGVLKGLITAFKDIDQELTVEQICATHRACMEGVKSRNPCEPGEFRKNGVMSEIRGEWVTVERARSFLASSKGKPKMLLTDKAIKNNAVVPLDSLKSVEKSDGVLKLAFDMSAELRSDALLDPDFLMKIQQRNLARTFYLDPKDISSIPAEVQKIVAAFNKDMRNAQSNDEKLLLLARLTQNLLRQEHPFRDGNNRLFVNCILVRLLMKHFGKIALFFDPNVFEMSTPLELVTVLKEAMLQADIMLDNPNDPVFNFDSSKVAEKYVALGKEFLKELNNLVLHDSRTYFNALIKRSADGLNSTRSFSPLLWSQVPNFDVELDEELVKPFATTRLTIYSR